MNTVICVPLHIREDPLRLNGFLNSLRATDYTSDNSFHWYIDANGCSPLVDRYVRTAIKTLPKPDRLYLHVDENSDRSNALNRSLSYASEKGFGGLIFLNDDISNVCGLAALSDSLDTNEIVGGRSLLGEVSEGQDTYAYNAAQQYAKVRDEHGSRFKGDLFGIRTSFIDEFPPIHSDGVYLDTVHKMRTGKPIPVLENVVGYRAPDLSWEDYMHRVARHFAGIKQLRVYSEENQPELLQYCPPFPDVEEVALDLGRNLHEGSSSYGELINAAGLILALAGGEHVLEGPSHWKRESYRPCKER